MSIVTRGRLGTSPVLKVLNYIYSTRGENNQSSRLATRFPEQLSPCIIKMVATKDKALLFYDLRSYLIELQ